MNLKKLHITLILVLICSVLNAQNYKNFTSEDGLPSDNIYRITQDSLGFIWICTDKGISKFNGETFKNFTTQQGLPTNDIWDLQITPDQKVWFMSKTKEIGYILKDSVYSFSNKNPDEVMFPLIIYQNKNHIEFGYSNYIYRLTKDKKWKTIKFPEKLGIQTNYQKVIHSTVDHFTFSKDTFYFYSKKKLIHKGFSSNYNVILNTETGQLNDSLAYFMNNKKYCFINLNTYKITTKSFKKELGIDAIKIKRIKLVNNTIQLSGNNFVAILDTNFSPKKLVKFPLKLNSHLSLIDKTGNAWLATFNNGIYKLSAAAQNTSYNLNNEIIGQINTVNNQPIINVFNKGFYTYNFTTNKTKLDIKTNYIPYKTVYISQFKTTYYLTNQEIIAKKNGKIKRHFFGNPESNAFARQLVVFKNKLYGNNGKFLNELNPTNFKIIKQYPQLGIRTLLVFKNKLLISTPSGIKYFDNDSIKPVNKKNKTFNQSILKLIKLSNSKLLFTTDGFGAYITDLENTIKLPKSDFLIVQSAFVDEHKNIFLATNKGVYFYKLNNNAYVLFKIYTIENGLLSNNVNSVWVKDSTILAGTNKGLCTLSLAAKNYNQLLHIYFEELSFNNTPIKHSNHKFKYIKNNQITAHVSAVNYSNASKNINYFYKLSPIQKKWNTTQSSTLNFSNLPPNNYVLNVKSANNKNTVNFTILPLWWQKTITKVVFWLLVITLFGFLLLQIRNREIKKKTTKLNTEKQLAEFELYALRSQMNPHFVFNSLNAIQYYITKNETELSETYLVKFSKLIRLFFNFSRETFITLKQEILLLKSYLGIEKMRFGNDFNFEIIVDKNLDISKNKIPTMLLQPIVENAVNHGLFHNSGKGLIKIEFLKKTDQIFIITISDNGVGIKKAQEIKKNSIKTHVSKSSEILKDRIALINKSKKLKITYSISELEKNKGTIVTLTFIKDTYEN